MTFQGLRCEVRLLLDYRECMRRTLWHSQERIDLIEKPASRFATLLFKSWQDAMLACIGRILDPSKTGKSVNLGFQRLIEELGLHDLVPDPGALKLQVDQFRTKYSNLIEIRNKYVGHLDYEIGRNSKQIKFAWGEIDDLAEELGKLCDQCGKVLGLTPECHRDVCGVGKESEWFVQSLQLGQAVPLLDPNLQWPYGHKC